MIISKVINIDLSHRFVNDPIELHEGDINGSAILLNVRNNSEAFDLTDCSAEFDAVIAGYLAESDHTAEISNGVITIPITKNMTATSGVLQIDVRIIKGNDTLFFRTIEAYVQRRIINEEIIIDISGTSIGERLDEIVEYTEGLVDDITEATEAAETAAAAASAAAAAANGKMDRHVELSSDDTSSLSKGQMFYYGTHYYIKSSLATPVGAQHGIADPSDIPTKTSELTNDSGFLTQHQDISGKADKATTLSGYGITDAYTKTQVDGLIPTVPTKTSDLTNDSGFLTQHQDISGSIPIDFAMHAGLVNSSDFSLYGNVSLGNYHACIAITPGEKYIISCRSSDSTYPGAFYTLNGVKVSAIFEDNATHLNAAITVPSGVDTLWLNSKSTLIPLDQWKVYKVLKAPAYCEANNSLIRTLESERIDEQVECMRRLKNLESLYSFRWKPFDKAYYCFVNDGSKSWLHVLYDVFHAHGAPLSAAVVGENIELANDTETSPGGRTVKQTLDAIIADGGEVLTYLNAAALSSTDSYETWYDYAVKNGKHMIEAYGYNVRGLILSAQSARNSAVGQKICERFFDYSDRVGIKPQYDIHRAQFSDTSTVADVKAYIDSTVGTPGFYPIMVHRPSQEPWATYAGMDEILTYIEGKGSSAAISTYSEVFDTFGTNGFLTLSDLPVYNGGVQ